MICRYQLILLSAFLCSLWSLDAQDLREEVVENLAENTEEDQDYATLIEELYALYDNPININEASADELEVLPMLSAVEIINLLNYREQVGRIYTLYELLSVKGFSWPLLENLQYFISFREGAKKNIKIQLRDMLRYSSNSLMLRGQRIYGEQYGYKELKRADFKDDEAYAKWQKRRYLGTPWRYYVRYETRYKDKFKVGFVAEKDPGEEFFTGTQKRGFDHYTGFVQINDIGRLRTAIIGDYSPRFGQGLATWGGYGMGKSGYLLNVNKRNEGLKTYTSTNENQYMRGIGVSVGILKKLELTTYYSNKKIDGNIKSVTDSEDDEEHFTSFLNSGYHRSHNEIDNRKVIDEKIIGANLSYRYKNLKLGTNFIDYTFSKPFLTGSSLSDLYDFSGRHGQNYSAYANYRYNRLFFFGEAAFDKEKAKALLGGVIFNADEQLNFSMLYRDYDKDYQALYATGFGDKSETKNERGWYIGMEMLPVAKWQLNAYFDMYEFPWMRSGVNAPSRGHDYKIRLEYLHSQRFSGYLQFYKEQNERNNSEVQDNVAFLVKEKRSKVRVHIDYEVMPYVRFKNRAELAFYKKESQDFNGFVIFHDIVYQSDHFPLSFATRYALFDVENYQARIYTYENDILYAFSTSALQNKGFRFYFNTKWYINKHFTLWAKYAITRYSDRKTISSGLNLLDGNRIQEIKLQLRYKF